MADGVRVLWGTEPEAGPVLKSMLAQTRECLRRALEHLEIAEREVDASRAASENVAAAWDLIHAALRVLTTTDVEEGGSELRPVVS